MIVAIVVVPAALAISPIAPFDSDEADDHGLRPLPDEGPATTTGTSSEQPPKPDTTTTTPPATTPASTLPPVPPAPTAPPAIQDAGYQLDFADDFQGSAPDAGIWAAAPFGNSLPATVADGRLTIRTLAENNHNWGYIASTGPRSPDEPSYANARSWQEGYFEARIRYTDNPWSWPAFWLFSMAKTEAWPDEDCSNLNSEWDIMENGVQNSGGARPADSWYFTALHRNTTDNSPDGYCSAPDTQRTFSQNFTDTSLSDWHTWSALWDPDTFCTYLDDVEIQCMEPYDSTSQPMHLVFTIQYLRQCGGCPSRPAELELQVDWVRVWQAP